MRLMSIPYKGELSNAGVSQQWNWLCENSTFPEMAQEGHNDSEKSVAAAGPSAPDGELENSVIPISESSSESSMEPFFK